MQTINVQGVQGGDLKPKSLSNALEVLAWKMADKLNLTEDFDIDIIVMSKVKEGLLMDGDAAGYCSCIDDDEGSFNIEIELARDKDNMAIFRALAHEMIHAKQYIKGELSLGAFIEDNGLGFGGLWKGKIWKPAKKQDGYYDSPWEKEAYEKEYQLLESVLAVDSKRRNSI